MTTTKSRTAPTLSWKDETKTGCVTRDVTFEVITPVFGGGVHIDQDRPHQKEIDPVTPVRGASIRGQLRFWWRATRGCRKSSVAEMLAEETRIWGNASSPGAVSLAVTKQPAVKETDGLPGGALNYATFPLSPAHNVPGPPGKLHELTGEVGLRLDYHSQFKTDVDAALQAWFAFGGIGGRTRRGFGAVSAIEELGEPTLDAAQTIGLVPSLFGARRKNLTGTFNDWRGALSAGLGKLQTLRQGSGHGRTKVGRFGGRSLWPEPELIRFRTGRRHKAAPAQAPVRKVARADFGMPIIFHFKDEKGGDPRDVTLTPVGFDRMASPLIIRPFRTGPDRFGCLALVLQIPGRDLPIQFDGKDLKKPSLEERIAPPDAQTIEPLKGQSDALSAFLHFFSQKG